MTSDTIGCLEAEAALLGCVLAAPRIVQLGYREQIEVEDFVDPRHRLVWTAVCQVLRDGGRADAVTVLAELRRSGAERSFVADMSAGVFLLEVVAAAPSHASAGWYALAVLEHRTRRRIAEAGERLAQAAGELGFVDLLDLLRAEVAEASRHLVRVQDRRRAEQEDAA